MRPSLLTTVSSALPGQDQHGLVRRIQDQCDGQHRHAAPGGDEGEDAAEAVDGAMAAQQQRGRRRALLAAAEGLKFDIVVRTAGRGDVEGRVGTRRGDGGEEGVVFCC